MDNFILNALPDPVLLLNAQREVVAANEAASAHLGRIIRHKDLSQSLRNPDILAAADRVLDTHIGEITEVDFPFPIARRYELNLRALDGPSDVSVDARLLLIFHDVTATRTAEILRSDFIADVSHELRSPLASLVGFIETLQTTAKDDPDAQGRFLSIMEGEASRMTALIDDLLSLSKIEASEHIRPQGRVNIERVIRAVIEPLTLKAVHKSMTIDLKILDKVIDEPTSELPEISGDEQELLQVFTNLIDNAIKYGRTETPITIKLTTVDKMPQTPEPGILIAIGNFGDVIQPEHLPRLTQRFYRIDKGRSRSVGGTGLGLAIVKHLVNHHRGHLAIESSAENGTVFSVYLPLGTPLDPTGIKP